MLDEQTFIARIKSLPNEIKSKTGRASYTDFQLEGDTLHYIRVNKNTPWTLNVRELYQTYRNNDFIDTTTIRQTSGTRAYSPSVAVLIAIGCIDQNGVRL